MNVHLKYIGMIDKKNCVHKVELYEGINVITGKSSTGKSALIEIFDYCMGSSEFTIPAGIITETADIYFIVWKFKSSYLILGRKEKLNNVFIKEENEKFNLKKIDSKYFDDNKDYFVLIKNFKKVLGGYFGLNINDVDDDKEITNYTKKKKPIPSIRNIMSYILQHQNLIANKHSLFYRFDEKEKREQTIEQFKIFMYFVDQEYFILKQKLHSAERELKKLERSQEEIEKQNVLKKKNLEFLLENYELVSGNKLFNDNIDNILINPAKYLDLIKKQQKIDINEDSNKIIDELNRLEQKYNTVLAGKRKLIYKLKNIEFTINSANEYKQISEDNKLKKIDTQNSNLGFINDELIKIKKAVEWLNNELQKTPYILTSLESDKQKVEKLIEEKSKVLKQLKDRIKEIKKINKNLEDNRSLNEQSLKIKLQIENLLESMINKNSNDIEIKINEVKKKISQYKSDIKNKYDVSYKLKKAEKYINTYMNILGEKFDFEESYKPLNLKFSLETFELWYEKKDGKKIYLRSMGSGANWLYSHLTLFLSLNKYFAFNKKSIIPPILFLDQPTQVYFPTSIKDNKEKFEAEEIIKQRNSSNVNVDEDLNAVINMFNQFVWHCKTTTEETGIKPQIIITDHVDNITLSDMNFEDLVKNRRWRKRGFINKSNCLQLF